MIALVTGASGFIGGHLVAALQAAGHEVRVVGRPLPPDALFHRAALWRGVTHVFHLAARTRAPHARAFHDANVTFTARLAHAALAQAALTQSRVPRFVFVSSLAAMGPAPAGDRPCTDADVPHPIEHYGRSKWAAEQLLQGLTDLPCTTLRLPAVYGPRDRDFLTLFRQVQRPLHWRATPGWHALTLAHVHDVVAALLVAAQHDATIGRTYGVGGDDRTWDAVYDAVDDAVHETARDTARDTASAPRRRSRGVVVPAPLLTAVGIAGGMWARVTGNTPLASPDKIALGRAPWWLCRGDRFRADTGWSPQVPLAEGLRDTARWYRDHGWL
ncbi:MAG: NAD(P)-dependent oxidoreductase [Gemmatimonadota bacterium]|nr:NAD(P)-dependent oxidoreductase [Gemmatimonadota bacterium]